MTRRWPSGLLLFTILGTAFASAAEPRYCVDSVPVEVPPGAMSMPDAAPNYMRSTEHALFPTLYDPHQTKLPGGKVEASNLHWRFTPDVRIVGPYETRFNAPRGSLAADPAGNLLMTASGSVEGPGGKMRWEEHLMRQEPNGIPQQATDIEAELGEVEAVYWSDLLDASIISGVVKEWTSDSSYNGHHRIGILRADGMTVVPDVQFDLAQDLPELGVTALLDRSTLSFLDRKNNVVEIARLNSGDDWNGWDGLYEMQGGGLYVDGVQYDHLVTLAHSEGHWKPAGILRVSEYQGIVDSALRAVLGMNAEQIARDHLSGIVRAGACRRFSPALKTMIFCDGMSILRGDDLEPIGGGIPLAHYLGDVVGLGLAIFRNPYGHLYSYDGKDLRPIGGATTERGRVQEAGGRWFVSGFSGTFELRGTRDDLQLIALDPPEKSDFFSARFFDAPGGDDAIAIMRHGVYRAEGDGYVRIWAPEGGSIDITGHATPVKVKGWDGVLFASRPGQAGLRFYLLRRCATG